MGILSKMTGAKPTTRLVFITWAALYGPNIQVGDRSNLAKAMRISKSDVSTALEYLEREGFLLKIKNQSKKKAPSRSNASHPRYLYALTRDSWILWLAEVLNCNLREELDYILCEHILNPEKDETVRITSNIRLLWAFLVLKSDSVGYVTLDSGLRVEKCLGMTKTQWQKQLRSLMKQGRVSRELKLSEGKVLSEIDGITYKINLHDPGCKKIKLGVNLQVGFLDVAGFKVFLFFRTYNSIYNKSRIKFPKQESELSDEEFFNLARFFYQNKNVNAMIGLCCSIVFSLLNELGNIFNFNANAISDMWLEKFFSPNYIKSLICRRWSLSLDGNVSDLAWDWLFDVLSNEIFLKLSSISKPWLLYKDVHGHKPRITGYDSYFHMMGKVLKYDNIKNDDESIMNHFISSCVFVVKVPDDNRYGNCMVLRNDILTDGTIVKNPKVSQVDEIFCYKLSTIQGSLKSNF